MEVLRQAACVESAYLLASRGMRSVAEVSRLGDLVMGQQFMRIAATVPTGIDMHGHG